MTQTTVSLTGTLPGAAGASYVLKPSGWRTDSTNLLLLPPKPVSGRLTSNADGSGSLAVAGLLATDESGPVPSGWTWSCGFSGIAGVPELDFSFFLPAGSFSFTATHASPAVFTAPSSTGNTQLANGMAAVLSGGSLPGGFTAGTYYLVGVASTTFGLAATAGGSPIASTSAGSGTLTVTQADISGLAQVQPSTPMAAYLQGSYPGGTSDFLRADGQWAAPPGMALPSGTPVAGDVPVATGVGTATAWSGGVLMDETGGLIS